MTPLAIATQPLGQGIQRKEMDKSLIIKTFHSRGKSLIKIKKDTNYEHETRV
jgi:hypothetical protein